MTKEKKKAEFIPLYKGIMFKGVFGNQNNIDFTTYLLENLFNLPEDSLKGSIIDNSVTLTKEILENKYFPLDIFLETTKGELYILEMEANYTYSTLINNTRFALRLFFASSEPVTLVNFIEVNKFREEEMERRFINLYKFRNPDDKEDDTFDDLNIYDADIFIKTDSKNKRFEELRLLLSAKTREEAEKVIENTESEILKGIYEEMERLMELDYIQDYKFLSNWLL